MNKRQTKRRRTKKRRGGHKSKERGKTSVKKVRTVMQCNRCRQILILIQIQIQNPRDKGGKNTKTKPSKDKSQIFGRSILWALGWRIKTFFPKRKCQKTILVAGPSKSSREELSSTNCICRHRPRPRTRSKEEEHLLIDPAKRLRLFASPLVEAVKNSFRFSLWFLFLCAASSSSSH